MIAVVASYVDRLRGMQRARHARRGALPRPVDPPPTVREWWEL